MLCLYAVILIAPNHGQGWIRPECSRGMVGLKDVPMMLEGNVIFLSVVKVDVSLPKVLLGPF